MLILCVHGFKIANDNFLFDVEQDAVGLVVYF